MIICESLDNLPDNSQGCVIAIGNFDGVHLGHQTLLTKAKDIAQSKNKKLAVLTFEPHPRRLFQPDQPPGRLTPKNVKAIRLKQEKVDILFNIPFDWNFASQSADDFVSHILMDTLKADHIVIGYNFRFGQLRQGSAETIKQAKLPIDVIQPICHDDKQAVSSSLIRQHIRNGMINKANALLGWKWEIKGKIFRGDQRGHALGYPTANILLGDTLHPAYGVYACLVQIEGEEKWHQAATNIGIRPMFEVSEGQVEAHILDFPDSDIYDKMIRVRPIKRLRGEAKFDSLDALIEQMQKDCQETRTTLDGFK